MTEKKLKKQNEEYVKEEFMKKWMQMAEEDNSKRKEKEELGKKKRIEVKDFLLMQIGGAPVVESADGGGSLSTVPGSHKKNPAGGGKAMNVEELRINKQLLKEISMKKKAK